jgi:hypothetical protein
MSDTTDALSEMAKALFELRWNLNQQEKKMLHNLFFEYKSEGLESKTALKKAVCILSCFR